MANKNNIIEINGKRYDARTGQPLSSHGPAAAKVSEAPKPTAGEHARTAVRQPARPSGRAPQGSKTLMRHAVKKPATAHKPRLKAQGLAAKPASRAPTDIVAVKTSVHGLDSLRAKRAVRVAKSELIRHFTPVTPTAYQPPAPSQPLNGPAVKPIVPKAAARPKNKPQTTAELLDLAVRHATSHEQPAHPARRVRHKHRAAAAAVSSLAVLLIAFVGYQEIPGVRLELASAKAGFNVNLPSHLPDGYSLGKMDYSQGVAALDFRSNSDDRHYTLTQKSSDWDSLALLDNFVVKTTDEYQTVRSAGRTVYLYGNHSATWVSGGVWYIVQSDGSLTNNQLIGLATSI